MQVNILHSGIKPELVLNAMLWRSSVRNFDKTLKVPDNKLEVLLECLRLSPSSLNIQPWKFIVVKDRKIRQELKKYSTQQSQLIDASYLVLLCSLRSIDANYIDRLIAGEKQQDDYTESPLENKRAYALSFIENMSKEELQCWLTQQVYIALGFLLSACVLLRIDACPIEAFNKSKFNKILGCIKLHIDTQVAVALGYCSDHDLLFPKRKHRWPKEDVVITI